MILQQVYFIFSINNMKEQVGRQHRVWKQLLRPTDLLLRGNDNRDGLTLGMIEDLDLGKYHDFFSISVASSPA